MIIWGENGVFKIIKDLFVGIRFFPNKKFEENTRIVGKKEIVTLGHCCKFKSDFREIFYQLDDESLLDVSSLNYEYISKDKAIMLCENAKSTLGSDEQLICAQFCDSNEIPDYLGFEFCGYDIHHDYEGGSALYDIGYPFNKNKDVLDKLNEYGLFATYEYALYFKSKVDADDTIFNDGEPTDDSRIFGLWRYIKQNKK